MTTATDTTCGGFVSISDLHAEASARVGVGFDGLGVRSYGSLSQFGPPNSVMFVDSTSSSSIEFPDLSFDSSSGLGGPLSIGLNLDVVGDLFANAANAAAMSRIGLIVSLRNQNGVEVSRDEGFLRLSGNGLTVGGLFHDVIGLPSIPGYGGLIFESISPLTLVAHLQVPAIDDVYHLALVVNSSAGGGQNCDICTGPEVELSIFGDAAFYSSVRLPTDGRPVFDLPEGVTANSPSAGIIGNQWHGFVVPEPSTVFLVGSGVLGIAAMRARRRP